MKTGILFIFISLLFAGNISAQQKMKRITSVPSHVAKMNCDNSCSTSSAPAKEEEVKVSFCVTLYPNPSSESTNIFVTSQNKSVKVLITNLNGVVVYKNDKVPTGESFSCADIFPSGIFIVKVMDGNKTKTLRLIRE